jgi:hypothetical protein
MRPRSDFGKAHILNSINLPVETCSQLKFYTEWRDNVAVIQAAAPLATKEKLRTRKRRWVFIIAGQSDNILQQNFG